MDKIKDICIFIETPLEKRDYERFGVEILRSRGFQVSFLDTTSIFNPDYIKNYQPATAIEDENIFRAKTIEDVQRYLANKSGVLGIDFMGRRNGNIFFYQLLKKFNIDYAAFYANCIPSGSPSVKGELRKLLMRYLPDKLLKIQPPRFVLAGGKKCAERFSKKGMEIIWAHTLDYDLFMKYKSNVPKEGKYIVYLDEYYPFHPDLLVMGLPMPFIDPDKYYGALCRMFDHIERETGLPVIIAAHPRSRYEGLPDYFKGRKYEKGKTIELVAGADLVLAHSSTSINFAVLFRKPIIFSTTEELEAGRFRGLVLSFAGQLKKSVHNLDRDYDFSLENELKVDEKCYSDYTENYIKTRGTPEKPFWEIVADRLLGGKS